MPPLSPSLLRWSSLALLTMGALAAIWQAPAPGPLAFAPPALPRPALHEAPASVGQLPSSDTQLGPASLTTLPDGRIAAAWLAGPVDDPSAGAIWFSIFSSVGWQPARLAATRESTAAGTLAHLNRLGRPVLWAEGGWLHLWYESRLIGEGPGAVIHYTRSTDRGQEWSKARRLQSSALGTTGSGLGCPPLALADGGLLLPVARRAPGEGGEWLRLAATGRIVDKQRLPDDGIPSRPAGLILSAQSALLAQPRYRTADAGKTWEAMAEAGLPATQKPVALTRLPDGRLLLAGNGEAGTQSLHLWASANEGLHWQLKRTIEAGVDGAADFADPALAVAGDGRIHLAYTVRRQQIRHRVFGEAWLDGGSP